MVEAIADRVQMAIVEESTYGQTPATPTFDKLRFTGETLKQETGTVDSQEIRSDRNVADHRRVSVSAAGDIQGELSYGVYDTLINAALQSPDWTAQSNIVAGISTVSFESIATSATQYAKILDSGSGFGSVSVGDIITVSGASNAENNATARVMVASAAELEVKVLNEGTDFVDEAAGATISVVNESVSVNGTNQRFYTIERLFSDITQYIRNLGMVVDTWSLQLQTEERITSSFSFMGSKEERKVTPIAGASYNDAPTNEIMTVVDNVLAILEDNTADCVTTLGIETTNELRNRQCIGELGSVSVGAGKFRATGSFELYFQDGTVYDKYLNFTTTSFLICLTDSAGNKYVIDLPQVKLSDSNANASGESSDVILTASWTAYLAPTEGYTMKVARIAA